MTYLIPLIVIAALGAYFLYMKKSGKFANLSNNFVEAEKEATEKFQDYFNKFKSDEHTFKPIVDIIGGDFEAIAACKKPKSIKGAAIDTAKTMLTGVVVENTNMHLLVLQKNELHYIEYNSKSKNSQEHWSFAQSSITNFSFEKAKLTDNLKQSMSFDLKDGGKSGDSTKNSDLHKLSFKSKDKSYEFFVYDLVGFGEGFKVENRIGGMRLNQTVDDIIRGTVLPQKLGKLFFDKIVNFK